MSRVGRGTTISLYLPRVEDHVDVVEPVVDAAPLRGEGETVLLVEDETSCARSPRRCCAARLPGHRRARSAGRARIAGERRPIDLLLTDIIVPRLGGRELSQKVAALVPGVRVLCMSGHTDDALSRQGSLDATGTFLEKPFGIEELIEKVRAALAAGSG